MRRIRPLLDLAGITRLADVTGLDRLGLPVYQAIRPASRNLSVSQGKGITRVQAKVSALMESLELYHAEELLHRSVRASVGEMRRSVRYDPYRLALHPSRCLSDRTVVAWVPAVDLCTLDVTWVPRELCELDFRVRHRLCIPRFNVSSNGLASGNTMGEALLHGLCEVIERDSLYRSHEAEGSVDRHIPVEDIHAPTALRVLDRFREAGMRVAVIDRTGPTDVATFEAWLYSSDSGVVHQGSGTHPSARIALLRALTEAAQSRLTTIAGSRDDMLRDEYRSVQWTERPTHSESKPLASVRSIAFSTFADAVTDVACRIMRVTGAAPLAVDLRRPEFDLPVVFVIAPGLAVPFE